MHVLLFCILKHSIDAASFIMERGKPAQSHTEVSCPAHTCHSDTDRACSAKEVTHILRLHSELSIIVFHISANST